MTASTVSQEITSRRVLTVPSGFIQTKSLRRLSKTRKTDYISLHIVSLYATYYTLHSALCHEVCSENKKRTVYVTVLCALGEWLLLLSCPTRISIFLYKLFFHLYQKL